MSSEFTQQQELCPDCGAAISPGERRCWLCGRTLPHERPRLTSAPASPPTPTAAKVLTITAIVLAALVVVVTCGLALDDSLSAAIFVACSMPVLVLIGWLSFRTQAGVRVSGAADVLVGVLIAMLIAVAYCVVMLAAFVSAIIGFFEICSGGAH